MPQQVGRLDCPRRHALQPATECTVGLSCLTRDLCLGKKKTARTWSSAPRFGTAAETTGGDSLSKQSGRKARSYRAAPSRPPGTHVLSCRPFPDADKTGLLRCDT